MVGLKRLAGGVGGCDGQILLNSYIDENSLHTTKYQSIKKIELEEKFCISVVYYLNSALFCITCFMRFARVSGIVIRTCAQGTGSPSVL